MSTNPKPDEPSFDPEVDATTDAIRKSKMLVALLGADFTKKTSHPFFRKLSQAAIQPGATEVQPNELSASLKRLMDRLENDMELKATPRRSQHPRPSPPAPIRKTEQRPKAPVQKTPDAPARTVAFSGQEHPALIAREINGLPRAEQVAIIRSLPGSVARGVSIFLSEMT